MTMKKANIRILCLLIGAALLCTAAAVLCVKLIPPKLQKEQQYRHAVSLAEDGQVREALEEFKALNGYKDSREKAEAILLRNGTVALWDVFGKYEMDNDLSNGKETLTWKMLKREKDKVLLVSWNAIDYQPFNTSEKEVTWESSSLRKWLNGPFFREAFSPYEQKMILETQTSADPNPNYSTSEGNDTKDRVFLLSAKEYEEFFVQRDPDSGQFLMDSGVCPVTRYAMGKGLSGAAAEWMDIPVGGGIYWLRTSGMNLQTAAVSSPGGENTYSGNLATAYAGVRPAIWVSIEP